MHFLINSLGGGGAEGVCITLANELSKRGYRINLIVLHLNEAIRCQDLRKDIQIINLHKRHVRESIFALYKYIKLYKPKKILTFNHQLAVLLILMRYFLNYDLKIISRNINTLSAKRKDNSVWHKYIVETFVKLFYSKVDYLIAQSNEMANDLIANYGFNNQKIEVIHNPISRHVEETSLVHSEFRKDRSILCVGRLEKQKAFHYAIEAFSIIADEFPKHRLKIVGQGSLQSELQEFAKKYHVYGRVDFEGYQINIIPYYLKADCTLLTSIYEGFPNVLLESVTLGTPIVAFNCPSGPSEIIKEGKNGYLVDYLNLISLTEALRKVLVADWKQLELKNTVKAFNCDLIVDQYETTLNSC